MAQHQRAARGLDDSNVDKSARFEWGAFVDDGRKKAFAGAVAPIRTNRELSGRVLNRLPYGSVFDVRDVPVNVGVDRRGPARRL